VRLTEEQKELATRGFNLDFRADLLLDNETVAGQLPIDYGGDISIDNNNESRRRCNLTVVGLDEWIPLTFTDPLYPVNNFEVRPSAIMDFYGRSTVEVPLGIFRITKPVITLSSSGDRAIKFEGYDRSKTVNRAKLTEALSITAGTELLEFLQDLIRERLPPDVEFRFDEVIAEDISIPFLVSWDQGAEVFSKASEMLLGMGYDLYFADDGACVLEAITDPVHQSPDFVHKTGPGGLLVSAARTLDDEASFNHVIVKGENTAGHFEVSGEAWDADPDSPTYIGSDDKTDADFGKSKFGDRLVIESSQFVQTAAQASHIAQARLTKTVGIEEIIEFETVWLPYNTNDSLVALIPELGVAQTYVTDACTLKLDPRANSPLAARRRRTEGV
jgi:hypothetical protein